MKKYMPLILLFVLINYSSYAQKEYSVANLEQASQEELNTYLDKALKLQKSGKTVAWVGVITFGVSTATMFATSEALEMGALIFAFPALAGLGAMTVGISMNVTGKKRVERINAINNTANSGIKFNLQPCAQYNMMTHNYQPGVTLSIRF